MSPEQRLLELDIVLPKNSGPAGNYAAAVRSGDLLYLSAKAPLAQDGVKPKGRLGADYTADQGYQFARSACIDLLATIRSTLGSLDHVVQVLELHGALNTAPEFEDHAHVLDGASDLLVEVFGPVGLHARSVVGVASLRNGLPLTIRATLRCRPI
jgi:enamine deaminase RidA (YjgF/YER057c/UK114 family)